MNKDQGENDNDENTILVKLMTKVSKLAEQLAAEKKKSASLETDLEAQELAYRNLAKANTNLVAENRCLTAAKLLNEESERYLKSDLKVTKEQLKLANESVMNGRTKRRGKNTSIKQF